MYSPKHTDGGTGLGGVPVGAEAIPQLDTVQAQVQHCPWLTHGACGPP